MSICAFGPMASPQQPVDAIQEPDATHFRLGDRWQSPAGNAYAVVKCGRAFVWLRPENGSGLIQRLGWDSIGAHSNRPWVRESWGGQP